MTNLAVSRITAHRNPLWDAVDALRDGPWFTIGVGFLVVVGLGATIWFFRHRG